MSERPDTEIPLFDPRAYARLLKRVSFIRQWFEPTITGVEHIPETEGALIVTNHGHFGMDLVVLLSLVLDATGRPVRALGDRIVFAAPFVRDWAHKLGGIEGHPEAAVELLRDDQLVLVYPGGAREALHDPESAYRLEWENSHGFIRTALRAQKPILPIAGIGNEELYVQVVSQDRVRETGVGRVVSKLLGEKYVPSLYMGLGPLPFPSDLRYIIGDPIRLPYGPEAADDREVVAKLHRQVTDATQALIDEGLREREQPAAKQTVSAERQATEVATDDHSDVLDDASESRRRVI
jgi:1-acyl-sn-glycerol-3-phosphate acyltransferase